jgi:hypothetical protein
MAGQGARRAVHGGSRGVEHYFAIIASQALFEPGNHTSTKTAARWRQFLFMSFPIQKLPEFSHLVGIKSRIGTYDRHSFHHCLRRQQTIKQIAMMKGKGV